MTNLTKSTRSAFIEALVEIGEVNKEVVTVAADTRSRFGDFIKKFPERSFDVGIAEQTMIGVAAGLALCGKIPVVSTYANFLVFRAFEQIRVDVASRNLNVKLIGTDTGFSSEWFGFTHMALEDMSAILSVPNIVIIDPSDPIETYYATLAIFDYPKPVYLRLRGRKEEPILKREKKEFKIGKGEVLREGKDVVIITCGSSVYETMKAASFLETKGIKATIINMPTIRPLDYKLVEEIVIGTGTNKIVTVEAHNIRGLGSVISEFIAEKLKGVSLLRIGVKDSFGIAGSEDMLKKAFKLDEKSIALTIEEFLQIERT